MVLLHLALVSYVVFCAYIIGVWVYRVCRKWPPGGVLTLPLVGESFAVMAQGPLEFARQRTRKYGSIFTLGFIGEPMVCVCNPVDVQRLLLAEGELVQQDWPTSVVNVLGPKSFVLYTGGFHTTLRKQMEPGMKQSVVSSAVPIVVDIIQKCVAEWPKESSVKAVVKASEITFQAIMRAGLGYRPDDVDISEVNHLHELFAKLVQGMFALPINLPGCDYHNALKARTEIVNVFSEHVARLKERASQGTAGQQLADRLIVAKDEKGQHVSDQIIEDNLVTVYFAGHDTSTYALVNLLYQLAVNKRVLEKIRAEQAEVIKKHGDVITAAALDSMTYLDVVIKESLRVCPTIQGVFRRASKTFPLGKYSIEKGTKLLLNVGFCTKFDPRWGDCEGDTAPDSFYPERWLTEEGRRAGAFMPFGSGVHLCIGWRLAMMELQATMAVLARGYTWELLNPGAEYVRFPFTCQKDGLPIRVHRLAA